MGTPAMVEVRRLLTYVANRVNHCLAKLGFRGSSPNHLASYDDRNLRNMRRRDPRVAFLGELDIGRCVWWQESRDGGELLLGHRPQLGRNSDVSCVHPNIHWDTS